MISMDRTSSDQSTTTSVPTATTEHGSVVRRRAEAERLAAAGQLAFVFQGEVYVMPDNFLHPGGTQVRFQDYGVGLLCRTGMHALG